MLARVTGLEPATSGVTGRRSNQLSYTRSGRRDLRPRADAVKRALAARRRKRAGGTGLWEWPVGMARGNGR